MKSTARCQQAELEANLVLHTLHTYYPLSFMFSMPFAILSLSPFQLRLLLQIPNH